MVTVDAGRCGMCIQRSPSAGLGTQDRRQACANDGTFMSIARASVPLCLRDGLRSNRMMANGVDWRPFLIYRTAGTASVKTSCVRGVRVPHQLHAPGGSSSSRSACVSRAMLFGSRAWPTPTSRPAFSASSSEAPAASCQTAYYGWCMNCHMPRMIVGMAYRSFSSATMQSDGYEVIRLTGAS
jgi:hypothetical protein